MPVTIISLSREVQGLTAAYENVAAKARMCEGTKEHQEVYYKKILGVLVSWWLFSQQPGPRKAWLDERKGGVG